jgi:amino acid adenylation domain-containing protein
LEAYAHQDMPFERVVEEVLPRRESSYNLLFQVIVVLQDTTSEVPELSSLTLTPLTVSCDITFAFSDTPAGLIGQLEFNADLFDATTITRLVGHLQTLLEGIVADPDQRVEKLPLLAEAERQQLLVEWNDTATVYPQDECIHQLFEAQVERTPDEIAVIFEGERLTYHELNQRANRLAHYLQRLGVGQDTLVALLAERGISFLISILAVFKAGGAYLPLDPHYPAARLRRLIESSRCSLVLASTACAPTLAHALTEVPSELCPRSIFFEDLLQVSHSEENLPICNTPRHLAYVIYTSGSTGMPKGAMVEHRGMLNHVYAKIDALDLAATDTVAQTASQCFDISVWQFLAALVVGGRVQIYPDEVAHDPVQLLSQVEQHQVSILETVPSLLRAMLDAHETDAACGQNLQMLRWLIPTGEALPVDLCRRWLSIYPHVPLLNAYGPTECSDDVTHHPIYEAPDETRSSIPIGKAIANMRVYVLDRHLEPLPIGVSGELYVGGIGVGRGYLGDERRTAEAFLPDPFGSERGARLYKTGDLARYLPDGNLEFLGRLDHQVKVRGFRIELGEIEAVLNQHPAVRQAVVVDREDVPGDKRLVAYVVLRQEQRASVNDLQSHVMKHVPTYMIPSAFVLLEVLPLTPNGKVDRKALPAPNATNIARNGVVTMPDTPTEKRLVEIVAALLGLDQVGIDDNIFLIGGSSLMGAQLIVRVAEVFGVELSLHALSKAPTIRRLASEIERLIVAMLEQMSDEEVQRLLAQG